MLEPQNQNQKPRRAILSFRFGLTSLLLATTLFTVAAAWYSDRSHYLISRTWQHSKPGYTSTLKIQADGTFVKTQVSGGTQTFSGTVRRIDNIYQFTVIRVSCDQPKQEKYCQLSVGCTYKIRAAVDGNGSLLFQGESRPEVFTPHFFWRTDIDPSKPWLGLNWERNWRRVLD